MSLICNNETYPSNIKLYQIQMFIGKGAFGDVILIIIFNIFYDLYIKGMGSKSNNWTS